MKIIIAFQKSITYDIMIMMVFLFTFYNFTNTSESRNIIITSHVPMYIVYNIVYIVRYAEMMMAGTNWAK